MNDKKLLKINFISILIFIIMVILILIGILSFDKFSNKQTTNTSTIIYNKIDTKINNISNNDNILNHNSNTVDTSTDDDTDEYISGFLTKKGYYMR